MFTGIVQGVGVITGISGNEELRTFEISFPEKLRAGLQTGASVAVNGVCLTATRQGEGETWFFDVMRQSMLLTNLHDATPETPVNLERSMTADAEVGGHILSGHVDFTAEVLEVTTSTDNKRIRFKADDEHMAYLFKRGYLAIDGISLTLSGLSRPEAWFEVWLIPETRRATIIDSIEQGYRANIEIDRHTQIVVDTIRDTLTKTLDSRLSLLNEALVKAGIDHKALLALHESDDVIETMQRAIQKRGTAIA